MKKLLATLCSLACLFALVPNAAHAQPYLANLNGAQDGGAGRQGIGTINFTLTGTTLTLLGSYSGLSSAVTAAHIHGPAGFGVNAGVIYGLGGTVIPLGGTSGAVNGSVSLAAIGSYTVSQQIADLNNSLWYVNIHDAPFPGGEIRGQIVPVPEPSTIALGVGIGAVLLGLRFRKQS